jgi:branched-chain amino acid transport system substrate-binding protein
MKCLAQIGLAIVMTVSLGSGAFADDQVRIGLIGSMSGPFAEFGEQFKSGVEAFQKLHGTKVAGKQIKIIFKDVGGPNPDVAKRLAQELIVRDKVDILTGFDFTPNAAAVASIATEAKVPMVVMTAAAENLTAASDYMVRVSYNMSSLVRPMVEWAVEHGKKKAYLLVSDYRPGREVEAEFLKVFPEIGGEVVGDVRTPVMTVDFSPYMQRIKDTHPDMIFGFVNGGDIITSLLKSFQEKGLEADGVSLLGTGDLTDEPYIPVVGDAALGLVTCYPYSMDHDSDLNRTFVKAYMDVRGGKGVPDIMGVSAFDAMAVIYTALEKTGGDTNGSTLIKAMKGMELESPRGPIKIDPQTRDIVQNIYLRRVEKIGDRLGNVEFKTVSPAQ